MAENESGATILAYRNTIQNPMPFSGNRAGLQAALDYVGEGGVGGLVVVPPCTIECDYTVWIHSNTHLRGAGRNLTTIKRASGSITDADAANSGAVLASSAYGANGTLSSSASVQTNIEVSDVTLDGNSQAFGSLASGTPHQAGILLRSVDGVRIHGVLVKNTLRSAYMLMECKSIVMSDVEAENFGQFSIATTKNAFDFYNYGGATTGHGVDAVLTNFRAVNDTVGTSQVAVSCTNMQRVAVSNGVVKNATTTLEVQGSPTPASLHHLYKNINAVGGTTYAVSITGAGGVSTHEMGHILISGLNVELDPSNHDTSVILLGASTGNSLHDIKISQGTFKNVNSKDTTTRAWVDMAANTASVYRNITIEDCVFHGKSGSTRTGDTGINLSARNGQGITLRGLYFKDVPGRAVRLSDDSDASCALKDVLIQNVFADGCNHNGFEIGMSASGAVLSDVLFDGCIAKDCAKQTQDSGFRIVPSGAGTAVSRIRFVNCVAYKTSGTSMLYGIRLEETAGSINEVVIDNCDLARVQTAEISHSGTPTNVHFTPRPGRGTDIASAATISIPVDGDVFHVTGTTNITNGVTVNPWDNGRVVTLIFDGVLAMSDTGTSKLTALYNTTADDTLTLRCDGTNWYEVSRSQN